MLLISAKRTGTPRLGVVVPHLPGFQQRLVLRETHIIDPVPSLQGTLNKGHDHGLISDDIINLPNDIIADPQTVKSRARVA
jgi:hypothetical protein